MSSEHQRNEPEASQPDTIAVPRQANAETGGEADPAGRSARILILEDEAWDAALAQRILETLADDDRRQGPQPARDPSDGGV